MNKYVRALACAVFLSLSVIAWAEDTGPRHLVFASDTQYPWTDKTDSREPESDAEFTQRSKWLVETQLSSIAEFRAKDGVPSQVPLMINGDITAFGHAWQRDYMRQALKRHFGTDYLYGLGNHDYENNVDDCFSNSCAAGSIVEFNDHHAGKVDSFDLKVTGGFFDKLYSGSLAYSKSFGDVHLVQLNNEPTYKTRIAHGLNPTTFDISTSLDWLENDLRLARKAGSIIIINMHKPLDMMGTDQQINRFREMIIKYKVTAMFAGHYHTSGGASYSLGNIPMYLSGSTSQQTYLVVGFSEDRKQMQIFLVTKNQWRERELIDTIAVKSFFTERT